MKKAIGGAIFILSLLLSRFKKKKKSIWEL
jgi:hypothetical protein